MENTKSFKVKAINKKGDNILPRDNEIINAIIEAENEADARKQFIDEYSKHYNEISDKYDIFIEEVSIKELIDKEQKALYQRLICKHIEDNYGDLSVVEFNTVFQSQSKDKMIYMGLKAYLKRLRVSEYLQKRLDVEKISHAEFCRICDALCNARDNDEIERISKEINTKYGKSNE